MFSLNFLPSLSSKFYLTATALSLSALSLNTQATLTSYTANGVDLVYSSVSDVTWTKDGNLLGSMMASQGFNNVVNTIIASSPIIIDTPNSANPSGVYTLQTTDFLNGGASTWWGAKAFINYLNATKYAGSASWRLPSVTDTSTPGCNFGFNGTDCGYNGTTNGTVDGDEFSELFYSELGSKGALDISGNFQPEHGFNDPDNQFTNKRFSSPYWTGTEDTLESLAALYFYLSSGQPDTDFPKTQSLYSWAISDGQITNVSTVPLPATAWLFITGLPIIGAVARQKKRID